MKMKMRMRMNQSQRKSLKKRKSVVIHESQNELCIFNGQEPPSNIDQPSSAFFKKSEGKGILKNAKKNSSMKKTMVFI